MLHETSSPNPIWTHDDSPSLLHQKIVSSATYSPWLSDQDFINCYLKIRNHTLVDIFRCYELWSIVKQLKNIEGCFVEVGVWRGGTGALLAMASQATCQTRNVFLADTFEGVVKAGPNDTRYKGGEHADTSMESVAALLKAMGLENAQLLKGIFPDQTAHNINQPIVLLHCDVDVYQSTKDIVDWAFSKLVTGGIIVFDDYGFSGCEGVTRYVDENNQRSDLLFLYNLNGHAIFIKR